VLLDDTLQVLFADQPEQIDAAAFNPARLEKRRAIPHQVFQNLLALDRRTGAEVFALKPKDIEWVKNWLTAAPQQLVKLRLAGIEADEFAVQDRVTAELCQSSAQAREGFEQVAPAGQEFAVPCLN
jgi:hypothetical protein